MAGPFRLCDIRGLYPNEVNETLLARIGCGIAARCAAGEPVLAARDHRTSSPSLHRALIDGLTEGGVTVLDAGAVPTPLLYDGKRRLAVRFAASVTASHNPASSNGLKILPPDHAEIVGEVRSLERQSPDLLHRARGSIRSVDLSEPYLGWLERRWQGLSSLKTPFVLDPGGGAWCGLALAVFGRLGLRATAIHDTPSGGFQDRSPDCTSPGALEKLGEEVRQRRAAAGFAWDGDGDRLAICDDTGRPLSTDQVALLAIPKMLFGTAGENVLVDLKMSRRVRETIEQCGGRPVVERSAHCLLERAMRQERCLFGCEYSGHFFYRELEFADDGMFAALQICSLLLSSDRRLSEVVDSLPRLFVTPDIRIPGGPAEFADIRERLTAEFRGARIDCLDGLRIETAEGWLLVRQSVSENKITWRLEAESLSTLDSILRRLGRILPEYRDWLGVAQS